VFGQYHAHPLLPRGFEAVQADLTHPGAITRIVQQSRPVAVIHCAAMTNVDACEADPGFAHRVNCDTAEEMAAACRQVGAQFILISTDAVFDGIQGGYVESDDPRPVNTYGRSKHAGELACAAALPQAIIVRTNFFGWPAPGKDGLAGWFLQNLVAGRPCPGFRNVMFNPIEVRLLAGILLELLAFEVRGVIHVGSADHISKFDFGQALARTFSLESTLIRPVDVADAGLAADRPNNLWLKTTLVESVLGHAMPGLDSCLSEMRTQLDSGYVAELQSLTDAADTSLLNSLSERLPQASRDRRGSG
jgi:dTDP-4-dehydrorhamnose reductase